MSKQDALDRIWEVPDDFWKEIEPLIAEIDPPKATGRKREDPRKMLCTASTILAGCVNRFCRFDSFSDC